MKKQAKWIYPKWEKEDVCPVFIRDFSLEETPKRAVLTITAHGVYEACINGEKVGDAVLMPGWTSYQTRLQYQEYDVTPLLAEENRLEVTVGPGWYSSPMPGWIDKEEREKKKKEPKALYISLHLWWNDGREQVIESDESFRVKESKVRFSEIYDGETYDASFESDETWEVETPEWGTDNLIPQQGEWIKEQERVQAKSIFVTPKGETVVDFGQEVTGYVSFTLSAQKGDRVEISHGEVLDRNGNFYTENYRGAKAKICYICRDGEQTYHPKLTFFGFRYIRLDVFPGQPKAEQFEAVPVHSDMKRTGWIRTSDSLLNQLFSNIIWGQKGNFLDVPTDCPQRDERLGWTGDAEVFCKTASYNFDTERFFEKWLADMSADQRPDGSIPHVIPDMPQINSGSAAWDDAAAICPWQMYLTYGNKEILRNQFSCMKKYIDYIGNSTETPGLWTGGTHYGDWLGLDAPEGSYRGSSNEDFIASAHYAHSVQLFVKAGKVLGEDMTEYEKLYETIRQTFREHFPVYHTQTEHVLAVWFELAENLQETADALAEMIQKCGVKLQTGFVGTPYLLHVLSRYGHSDLAYRLLLRREYPSWLYPVEKGATTIWEHWDGIMQDGGFWSADMNSFNHYAYGAVADWIYEEAAGIHAVEEAPGFEKIRIEPHPDTSLDWLEASIDTRRGRVSSKWEHRDGGIRYEITVPSDAVIVIDKKERTVKKGSYLFFGKQ